MNLEPRTLDRIAAEFLASDQPVVMELLGSYSGPEAGRVVWNILNLSKGKLEDVRHYFQAAQVDYRDVLYWAENYDKDPMLRGRDPKKMVKDLLEKWGDKKQAG